MNWLAKSITSLGRGVQMLVPSCRQAARLQSQALDGKLPFFSWLGLKMHLLVCRWCRRYGKQIRLLRRLAQDDDPRLRVMPHQLSSEARQRLKRAVEEARNRNN